MKIRALTYEFGAKTPNRNPAQSCWQIMDLVADADNVDEKGVGRREVVDESVDGLADDVDILKLKARLQSGRSHPGCDNTVLL